MKKKLFFAMVAGTMLFATSCQNDLDLGLETGENAIVSFSVSTPQMSTRAYSDGTTATHLQYAVYDANGLILPGLTQTNATINGCTTVELQLTTGNTYSVIFWAAAEGAPYTVDFANKTMTVDYNNALSNDENRDAFYAYETFTVNGVQTETIELRRPFAQLNIGTADYTLSASAGYIPTHSEVTVKDLANTLNLESGAVSGETSPITFASNTIPSGETFPVDGHQYLAMNYILVGNEKGVVDVEFTYTDGSNAKTCTVGSVPVQRNFRTNIFGNILTSEVDINVEIIPEYNEPNLEADPLHLAAAFGGEVTLTENVALTEPLYVQANMVINLGNFTISNPNGYAIENNAELTINATNGGINGLGGIRSKGGKVTINGGTIIGNIHAVYVSNNGGVANLNGGYYDIKQKYNATTPYRMLLNCGDTGYKNGISKIIVKGGEYVGFDPAQNDAEGANTSYVAAGYKSEQKGNNYVVVLE